MDFQVLQPIVVTEIGVFSNNAYGHDSASPGTDFNAAIFGLASGYSSTSGTIVPATEVSFLTSNAYSVTNNWLFQSIAPVLLQPGYYTIVAQGYNGTDMNGNLGEPGGLPASTENTGGGLISFGGGARYEAFPSGGLENPVNFPSTLDGGPSNRYYAGDFLYAAAPVPEPVSMLLIGLGLVGLGFRRRWQS